MSATNNLPTLSLEAAKIASEAAQEKAKEMGIGTSFFVVVERHSPHPRIQSNKRPKSIKIQKKKKKSTTHHHERTHIMPAVSIVPKSKPKPKSKIPVAKPTN